MKNDLFIKNNITIPEHEIEIITSRAGGPGGQHVNKTNSRITVRWNVKTSSALDEIQKNRILDKLQSQLTNDGDLIIHNSESRSQQQNKKLALEQLAQEIRKGLHVPKKRVATKIPKGIIQAFAKTKSHRSSIKKLRNKKIHEE